MCRGMLQGSPRLDTGELRGAAAPGGSGEPPGEVGSSDKRGLGAGGGDAGSSPTNDDRRRFRVGKDGRPGLEPD